MCKVIWHSHEKDLNQEFSLAFSFSPYHFPFHPPTCVLCKHCNCRRVHSDKLFGFNSNSAHIPCISCLAFNAQKPLIKWTYKFQIVFTNRMSNVHAEDEISLFLSSHKHECHIEMGWCNMPSITFFVNIIPSSNNTSNDKKWKNEMTRFTVLISVESVIRGLSPGWKINKISWWMIALECERQSHTLRHTFSEYLSSLPSPVTRGLPTKMLLCCWRLDFCLNHKFSGFKVFSGW